MIKPTMDSEKTSRQNRVREALGRIYDQHPPYFREYLRRYKEDPTSRVFAPLAEAYRRMGRVDEAIEVCREGLEHHPDFHGGRVALAKCYLDKRLYVEARGELDRVVQFAPENLLAQKLLGDVCLQLKDRQGSLHAYKMALMLSPNDVALAERIHVLEREVESAPHAPIVPATPAKLEETVTSSITLPMPPETAAAEAPAVASEVDDIPPLWDDLPPAKSEPPPTPEAVDRNEVEALLADDGESDDAFRIEHVSAIFSEERPRGKKEITTETLGDLYFSQGQFDRSLRIFEKLAEKNSSPELSRKIQATRARLGVDRDSMLRRRQIAVLRAVLKTVQSTKG
jgi:tetratricopeptide (TPR) repeat protein